ncbi:MAG TPA: TolC family protein [Tahibacter sp.]|nr:TolC family protein [Tahibacter sp.]
MILYRLGRRALAVVFAVAPFAGMAQDALPLREALERTLKSNPDLAAYQYVLKAQDGRIAQAGLKPNPTLSASLENVLGTGQVKSFDNAELTLSLSQLIELGGLRDKRVAVARGERETLAIDGHIRRLDVVAETARRFVTLASLQEQHRLTHQAVELAEKTAVAVDRRIKAAKSPLAEQERAVVALERARNDDAHAEHEILTARYALAAAWGATEPDFERANADLYDLTTIAPYDTLLSNLQATPDLERYLSEARMRESEVTLALASAKPGIEVGVGLRRLQGSRDTALVFSVGMPLPVYNRNQGFVAEAQARASGAQAQRDAEAVKARTSLFGYYRELVDRRREVEALAQRALPSAESALKNTEYAYERGRYGYLEFVDAQRELLSVKRSLIDAATQYHLTLIEIERLTGTGLRDARTTP